VALRLAPVPGQKFGKLLCGWAGDVVQDVREPGPWINIAELGGDGGR
jgi:hypothetical protein